MASLNDSHCRLAFLGEGDDEYFLEPLSTQTAVSDCKFFTVRQLKEYKDFGCTHCVLYSPTPSIPSIISLVDKAGQCPTKHNLILLLLKNDTTVLERALTEAGKSVQIILLKEPKVLPAAELINSYLILEGRIARPGADWKFYGASELVRKLYSDIRSFACWNQDPVLILGQTGTGKELVANYLHELYREAHGCEGTFHAQNLAAVPLDLAESILFGYKRGAFTGADKDSKGLIIEAGDGTLFLDEIGETHLSIQAKLLRVLQERKVSRLGRETYPEEVKARFVFATNRELHELKKASRQGKFKEDFLQRIDVLRIRVPSLGERREDIPHLVQHFIDEFKSEYLEVAKEISARGGDMANEMLEKVTNIRTDNLFKLDLLFDYKWPGNVRELRGVVRQSIMLTPSGAIDEQLAEALAQKQKDEEREQAEPETGEARPHAPQRDERIHALGSAMKWLLGIDLKIAQEKFTELYKQNLFLQTGGAERLLKRYSGMKRTWCTDLNSDMKRSEFNESDLRKADRLAATLLESIDPVSMYIRAGFERQVEDVANHRNGSHTPDELVEALIDLLNDLRKDPQLCRPELFQQVELSDEAKRLLKDNGRQWTDLMSLNHILLEDAYPEYIEKNESIRAEVRKRLQHLRLD